MRTNHWRVCPADPARASRLAARIGTHPRVGQLLLNRGITEPAEAARFLLPRLDALDNPLQLPHMPKALARIHAALRHKELIWVFGDSDVDGITASAIVYETLRARDGRVSVTLSNRIEDGYGLPPTLLPQATRAGVGLLILVDCGTNQREVLEAWHAGGIDVIVLDHHVPMDEPARPMAMVNPYQGSGIGRELCSAGLAFKLAQALHPDDAAHWHGLLDLAALGTLADYAPLRGDSRILVASAHAPLRETERPGLRQLYEAIGIATPSPETILRKVTPVLNAAGRLGNPRPVWELLVTRSATEATTLLATALECYAHTKRLNRQIIAEANAQVDRLHFRDQHVMVVGRQGWHPGLMGPLAAQLAERFGRPAIAIAFDAQGIGVGSGRSPSMFDLLDALRACDGVLMRYGGHPRACGLTVAGDRLDAFRETLNRHVQTTGTYAQLAQTLEIDAEVLLEELTPDFAEEASGLAPFGVGNPKTSVLVRGVRVREDEDGAWLVVRGERRKLRKLTDRLSTADTYDVVVTPSLVDGQCVVSLRDARETTNGLS